MVLVLVRKTNLSNNVSLKVFDVVSRVVLYFVCGDGILSIVLALIVSAGLSFDIDVLFLLNLVLDTDFSIPQLGPVRCYGVVNIQS
jgi:hypothetical protein